MFAFQFAVVLIVAVFAPYNDAQGADSGPVMCLPESSCSKIMKKLIEIEAKLDSCIAPKNKPELIAYFPFETDYKDTVLPTRTVAASGGVSLGNGRVGKSAVFSGNGQLNVDAFKNYNWGSKFSVSVWFKRTGGIGNYQGIVGNGYFNHGSWEIRMGREQNGQMLGGTVFTQINPRSQWAYVGLTAASNRWHHVVMTYDGDNGEFLYYLDNALQSGPKSCCSGPLAVKNTPLTIGKAGFGTNREFFVGHIDEVRLYRGVLSSADVSRLYNDGLSGKSTEL